VLRDSLDFLFHCLILDCAARTPIFVSVLFEQSILKIINLMPNLFFRKYKHMIPETAFYPSPVL